MSNNTIEPIYHKFLLWTEETKNLILRIYNMDKLRVDLATDVSQKFDPETTQLKWLTASDFVPEVQRHADGTVTVSDLWLKNSADPTKAPNMAAVYSTLSRQEDGSKLSKPNTLALAPNTAGVFFYGMSCCEPDELTALVVLRKKDGSFVKGLRHTNEDSLPPQLRDIFTSANSVSIVDHRFLNHLKMHITKENHDDCSIRGGYFAQDAKKRQGFNCEVL